MSDAELQQIQKLQFSDACAAASRLLPLLRDMFDLDIRSVQVRPLAVSLNSINGTLKLADGQGLFFKTHVEPDSAIGEYYRAEVLSQAGWPVVRPVHSSTAWGRQLLVYELIEDPTVFDLAWQIEMGDSAQLEGLQRAQHTSDEELLALYLRSLAWQTQEEAAAAAVQQLFWHRLTGGRMASFYGSEASFDLPHGRFTRDEVWQARWTINGQRYDDSLARLIECATTAIRPDREGPSIVGHGDAHNGNVFLRDGGRRMVYFDPAFAGRHHPLLDLAKPLFHNAFAMWMYFPQEMAGQTDVRVHVDAEGRWLVEHDYRLPELREMFFRSKVQRVLRPLLHELSSRGWLQPDWRRYLKLALFCCPLLTMNLADGDRFPPSIALLGLTQAIETGAESQGRRSVLDQALDGVAARL